MTDTLTAILSVANILVAILVRNELANLLVDPISVSKGIVTINGAITVPASQKVPEPSTTAALLGISICFGTAFLPRSTRRLLST